MNRPRVRYLAAAFVVLAAVLGIQAVTADQEVKAETVAEGPYEGHTLISVQSYKLNGRLIEVNTSTNDVVWEYDPPNSRVFDAEQLENGNVLVAVTTKLPPSKCPEEHLQVASKQCIQAKVLELDYPSKEVVWNYSWYDEYITHHEVHDVDRLSNGETAIIDMGNDRAFTVNQQGEITWEWQAENHLAEGTEFHRKYGGPPDPGGEKDWTHMNDIDKLENGNFQISVRNFDVVIEVSPETNEIVDVVGRPGNHAVMNEQHNPDRLEGSDHLLVADSQNDRVVELNATTGDVVWKYGGKSLLHWPRDADRLPNGNTLITDTFNNRVVEINPDGEVVWRYEGVMMPYSADRMTVPENSTDTVPATQFDSHFRDPNAATGMLQQAEAYAAFVFPGWVRLPELVTMAAMVVVALWLLGELVVGAYRDYASEE
ncbi:aryl-sulfate sulfotransferase [Halomicrococcus sp. SG-WS-1]|uniref:aryl-sulfate sulfotransferase n=1 Tax=Halomicrococcus sp. SG-WS-1 TaxID=3439057 RepID=UPI003F78F30C